MVQYLCFFSAEEEHLVLTKYLDNIFFSVEDTALFVIYKNFFRYSLSKIKVKPNLLIFQNYFSFMLIFIKYKHYL